MKTRYKYIHFQEGITCWFCYNNKTKDILGTVDFYKVWRQYIFIPASDKVVFSRDCLEDIIHFMKELNQHPQKKD